MKLQTTLTRLAPALCGLALASSTAWAQDPGVAVSPAMAQIPPTVLAQAVALASEAAIASAPAGARVQAQPGLLDARLRLAPCQRVEAYRPAGVLALGRTRIGLRCVDGMTRWQVFLPVLVQAYAPAVVAASVLPADTPLTLAHLRRAEVEWSQYSAPLFTDPLALVGRVPARNLNVGEPLQASQLKPRVWFAQGETIRVEVKGAGFAVVTSGVAQAEGIDGRMVKVETENGRQLMGRATQERRVEVNL